MWFTVRYIIIAETISNYFNEIFESVAHISFVYKNDAQQIPKT